MQVRFGRGALGVGIVSLIAALLFAWWRHRISGIDLGDNDFAGLFYSLVSLSLMSVAGVFAVGALIVGLLQLFASESRHFGIVTVCSATAAFALIVLGLLQ